MQVDEVPSCDVFIIHSEEDSGFVSGFLRPALKSVGVTVRTHADHELGRIRLDEAERAIERSRVTLLVVSPASEHDRWTSFEMKLARSASVTSSDPELRVVPLLLSATRSSSRFERYVHLDFRSRVAADWEAQVVRLCRALKRTAPPPARLPNPFVGDRAFTEGDARWFRGRRREKELIAQLMEGGTRELYLLGASGSGKSSLVHAGVLPAIRANRERRYCIRQLAPGPHPEARLVELLGGGASIGEAVRELLRREKAEMLFLVVDPLEALLEAAETRSSFLSALGALRSDGRCVLMGALRSSHVKLLEGVQRKDGKAARVNLDDSPWPMREVIEEPARAAGLHLEPALVERLLSDLRDAPGALALMQLVLCDLVRYSRRGLIALHDYDVSRDRNGGRLREALTRQASKLLASLEAQQRETADEVLLRLFKPTAGPSSFIGGAMPLGDPGLIAVDRRAEVISKLVSARLLVRGWDEASGEAVLRPAHSLLAETWPDLMDRLKEQERRARAAQGWRFVKDVLFKAIATAIFLIGVRELRSMVGCGSSSGAAVLPAETVRFEETMVRPGGYSTVGRPSRCSAPEEAELHCVASEAERSKPVRVEAFELDVHEVTNRSFAAWLHDTATRWELTRHGVARLRASPNLPLVWAAAACGGGLLSRGEEIVAAADKLDLPATCVTWIGASLYCADQGKRLPLEVEWEHAAKGAEERAYPWGAARRVIDVVTALRAETPQAPRPVGRAPWARTPEGIDDLGGNVAEWVESPRNTTTRKMVRGGHWSSDAACGALTSKCELREVGDEPSAAEAKTPDQPLPDEAFRFESNVGFRCARSVKREAGSP